MADEVSRIGTHGLDHGGREHSVRQPTAHLVHGFVCAGKTTLARRLERQFRAVRFTHDEWMNRLYGPNPPAEQFAELYAQVDALIWQCAKQVLACGVDVILDHGFWSRESRDEARSRLEELGARAVLYNVTCPEDVMRRRLAVRTNRLPEDSLWINEQAFELFKRRFEPLAADEARVLVDGLAAPATEPCRAGGGMVASAGEDECSGSRGRGGCS
jgi:predicted kinase